MNRFHSLLSIAAAAIALSCSASAATLSYTFSGGPVTGSLNGVPFTADSFSLSATGESSTVQSGVLFIYDAQRNVVTAPVVQINTNTGPLTTTLLSTTPGFLWNALSFTNGADDSAYGFMFSESFGTVLSAITFNTSYHPPDLSTPATYTGFHTNTQSLPTTDGTLNLSFVSTPVSFNISVVPEPATATSSLLLSLAGLSLISRRKRKA